MTPDEFDTYTRRYSQLKAEMFAAGVSTADVKHLEYPNCELASRAGARCRKAKGCVARYGGYFPCRVCEFDPGSADPAA